MKVIILLFVSSILTVFADDVDILCTTSFCEDYLDDNTCADVSSRCSIQNTTHNGVFLPFADACNCCDYCVTNLDEGDACAVGDSASPIPTVICGDMLYCTPDIDAVTTCETIVTDCTNAQLEYDDLRRNGTLGHLAQRPTCDRRGSYSPFQCIPGEICYCIAGEGERIFGEMPFTVLASTLMNCECSRKHYEATAFMGRSLYNGEFLRCTNDGNYDPIQCIDDDCFCVHRSDGSLAINLVENVNITSISNETLSCFNSTGQHVEGEYYRECEAQVLAVLEELAEYEELDYEVFGYIFPNCQLDGFYAPVQKNDTSIYCAAPDGTLLEDFSVSVTDELAENMNCKCARVRSMDVQNKPDCCLNGNYQPMQCRRGLCRCVDENGNQIEQEVLIAMRESLSCFNTGCGPQDDSTDDTDADGEDADGEDTEASYYEVDTVLDDNGEGMILSDNGEYTEAGYYGYRSR